MVLVVGGLGGSVKTTGLFYDLKRGLKWPEMNTKLQLKGTFFNTSLNLGSCKRPQPPQVRLTQRLTCLACWATTLPSRKGGAGVGRW